MIYGFVLGDHTIHIKSDVILWRPDSEDHEDEDEDGEDGEDDEQEEDDEEEEYDEEEEEVVEWPADILEVTNSDRGPLYHSICDDELLHPKDSRLYRIRSLEASGSRSSRVQSNMIIKDFKHAKCEIESDLNLECETIGSLEEDKPTKQVSLAFLRVNKQVYQEASTVLFSTRTFGFDDPFTFAKFFSINCRDVLTTNGMNIPFTERNTIKSVQIRAKTGLCLHQRVVWSTALNAATLVLPRLNKIRVTFDLCHEGNEHHVDGTQWYSHRHSLGFPLLRTAEVRVATHFMRFQRRDDGTDDRLLEYRDDVVWGGVISEDDVRHHMDALFGTLPTVEGEQGEEGDEGDEGDKGDKGEERDGDEGEDRDGEEREEGEEDEEDEEEEAEK